MGLGTAYRAETELGEGRENGLSDSLPSRKRPGGGEREWASGITFRKRSAYVTLYLSNSKKYRTGRTNL